jgi:LPS-assembly lipoprotein
LQGEVKSLTAYSATASLFATRAAERDAERRIAVDLAERIAVRVAAMEDGLGLAAL